jgi:hypothetical protein
MKFSSQRNFNDIINERKYVNDRTIFLHHYSIWPVVIMILFSGALAALCLAAG